MFHYSVSRGNKNQVKGKVVVGSVSGRDILVLSHDFNESISLFTSNWQPVKYFGLEKVIVRCVWNQCPALFVIIWQERRLNVLRGKKEENTITKRSTGPLIKKVGACDGGGVMWSTSFVTDKGKRRRKTIAHLSQTHEKRAVRKMWSVEVTCCHNSLFGRGNSIFSLLRACPPELATFRKQTNGRQPSGRWNLTTSVFHSEHTGVSVRQTCHTFPLPFYSHICHMRAASIFELKVTYQETEIMGLRTYGCWAKGLSHN